MNAVVKALTQPWVWRQSTILPQQPWVVWVLAILLLLSALSVVFMKDHYRRSYLQYQDLEQQEIKLTAQHNWLLLENATRLAQSRLATFAKMQGMGVPNDDQIVWLRVSDRG